MWAQTYTPISNNLALSALVAALPIFVLLVLLGILRKPAWISSLTGVRRGRIGGDLRLWDAAVTWW